ncbi:SRR1-like protein isoform X2 [Monomorium pharaonis]|uniref:SRR1-like protein isoform X2 n=1 Tax=Monomorium pharaonis TaxID=307658 RepID=UPI001746126D|nr:SRR1-like protein isoform X2 [Monomorium pharaonis]
MSDADGFVLVTRRGRRRDGQSSSSGNAAAPRVIAEEDREDGSFLRRLTESLAVLGSNGLSEIVCYGLGRFSLYRSARCQLAFLLCLKARYEPARVHVYDPEFRPHEMRALRALGLEVTETNEEGKRAVQRDKTTLVFMPHCSRQLTNNFLYANWGCDELSGCILFTNSLSRTVNDSLHRDVLNSAGYMLRILPYVTEIQLENSFVYEEVFSDLNIHIFTKQDLLKAPADFWSSKEEPRYSTKDVEFVTAARTSNT